MKSNYSLIAGVESAVRSPTRPNFSKPWVPEGAAAGDTSPRRDGRREGSDEDRDGHNRNITMMHPANRNPNFVLRE